MKLLRYQDFIKESKEDIHSICKKYDISNYTINEDGSIDVNDVDLSNRGLTELPLKFGKVSGNFFCDDNKLKSLEGSPSEVGGDFLCHNNQLTNLSGAPREVGGEFSCCSNQLTSLEGSPHSVGGEFICSDNKLTSLEGISKYISFGIYCENNKLRDVKGIRDGWRGDFWIDGNPVHEIFKLFKEVDNDGNLIWDEVIEYLNEYEVIRDGKVVILQALELVFHEMGLEVPEIDQIEGYQIQY